jgi:hypothetical protein
VAEQAVGYQSDLREVAVRADLTPESLRAQWPNLLKFLRQVNLPLEAHFRSCELVDVDDDVVVLGFAYQMNCEKVGSDDNRRSVEDALAELTGHKVTVRCVTLSESDVMHPGATQQPLSAQEIIEKDPLIRMAVQDFGAKIVQPKGQDL